METWTTVGWVFVSILLAGAGFLGGALLLSWHHRKQLSKSIKHILDRLKVAESDLTRLSEDLSVLQEYFHRRGLLDEEDLAALRRDLIERPRQLEAEKDELLDGALKEGREDRLVVKNTPDTLH